MTGGNTVNPEGFSILKLAVLPVVAIALVAVAIELFVFNFPSVCTASLGEGRVVQATSTSHDSDNDRTTVLFEGVDSDVRSIEIAPSEGLPVKGDLYVIDEGSYDYLKIEDFTIDPKKPASWYFLTNPHGKVASFAVICDGGDGGLSVPDDMVVNVSIPIHVSGARIAEIMAALAIAWCLRPSSRLFRVRYVPSFGKSAAIWAGMGIVALVVYVSCTLPFVEASRTFDAQANASYAELARAFAKGQLHLLASPPHALDDLANPYDPHLRYSEGIRYLWDHAYFDGEYYVYFGVLPALVFHLPWYLATGQAFPNEVAVLVSLLACNAGFVMLINGAVRLLFPDASIGAVLASILFLAFGSFAVFLLKQANVYTLPIAMGLMCAVFALAFWTRSLCGGWRLGRGEVGDEGVDGSTHARMNIPLACTGSLFLGLTLACRPQFAAVGVLGALMFAWALRMGMGRGVLNTVVFAPFVAVACLVGWYNFARFGNPLDFGSSYNLTTNDMTHRVYSVATIPQIVYSYFFMPPSFDGSEPFLLAVKPESWTMSLIVAEPLFGGVAALAPFLLLGLAAFGSKCLGAWGKWACATCGILAVAIAVFDGEAAGLVFRYVCDFSYLLAVPSILVFLSLENCEQAHALAEIEGYGQAASPAKTEGFVQVDVPSVADAYYQVDALSEVEDGDIETEAPKNSPASRVLLLACSLTLAYSAAFQLLAPAVLGGNYV